jgi:type VII secretion integral membrane protein EccD
VATGLARITVSTPHRRLDLAVPDQAPVAELLPELLRHAGDAPEQDGGWALRRADGAVLAPARGLASQGVVDGAVLHLTPVRVQWSPPSYDDIADAVATGARGRGAHWSPAATWAVLLVLAAVLLAGGLAAVLTVPRELSLALPAVIAGAALVSGSLATRRGHQRTGALLDGAALAYAAAAGVAWAPAGMPAVGGTGALAATALLGGVAATAVPRGGGREDIGGGGREDTSGDAAGGNELRGGLDGRWVHPAGVTMGLLGLVAALAAAAWGPAGAAAVLACVLVCGVGALPMAAMRWGGLPTPPIGGDRVSPGLLGREVARAAVARADELLTGALVGWSLLGMATVGVLVVEGGAAGKVLGAITATALVLRSRLFEAVRYRLPLLAGGLGGYAVLAAALVTAAPVELAPLVVPVAAGAALLLAAVGGPAVGGLGREEGGRMAQPWWGRVADAADTLLIVAVVPVAAVVLDLYAAALDLIAPG